VKRRSVLIGLVLVVVLVGVLVLVGNVGVAHSNPAVTHTIAWDSPRTEQLMRSACFDCHSNETAWPWYSFVAPASFLVAKDVNEGRDHMNLSTGHDIEADEMIKEIRGGDMPPAIYLPLHPAANLSADDKAALIAGIEATFGRGD
jgi:hypothetical protein